MIARYFAERFPLRLFGPIALALAFAASAGQSTLRVFALDVLFVLIALAHFRLWDDLADRTADSLASPHRVLVRASSTRPFVAVCWVLGAVVLVLAFTRGGSAVAIIAALQLGLAIWYSLRGGRSAFGSCIVLSKYPLILLAAAGDRVSLWPAPVAIAALAAYAAACAYEAWHDPAAFSLGGQ